MCGETSTGKTTYMAALFAEALKEWALWAYPMPAAPEGAWWIKTHTLLEQHSNWSRRVEVAHVSALSGEQEGVSPTLPLVTVENIRAAKEKGFRPRLFLDEFDKAALTPTKTAALFELIDTVYNCDGQLVVGTNMTPREQMSGTTV